MKPSRKGNFLGILSQGFRLKRLIFMDVEVSVQQEKPQQSPIYQCLTYTNGDRYNKNLKIVLDYAQVVGFRGAPNTESGMNVLTSSHRPVLKCVRSKR